MTGAAGTSDRCSSTSGFSASFAFLTSCRYASAIGCGYYEQKLAIRRTML